MSRFVTALAITALILGICSYSLVEYRSTSRDMTSLLDEIEAAALAEEDSEIVSKMCEDYRMEWTTREKKLMRTIRHPQLDEISSMTAELKYLATGDGYSHLLAAVDRIRYNLEKVGDAEFFNG